MTCRRPNCSGQVVDGYCDECGMAPARGSAATEVIGLAPLPPPLPAPGTAAGRPAGPSGPSGPSGAPPSGDASGGAEGRTRATPTASSRRNRIGDGLVEIPPIPTRDPADAVMAEPHVDERRRFCSQCNEPVGRSRGDVPGRAEGFCRKCGTAFSFVAKLRKGELVAAQYEVAGPVAYGGLGWIYLAMDRKVSDRWVALKGLLNSGDEDAMAAALSERRFLAEVEHPNIVKIHNFVEYEGDGYIVMEYVNGTSLRKLLAVRRDENEGRPDPLPVEQAIAYMLDILPALGHLHDLGLLYCDFKPDNVMQTPGSLKLIDLGGVYRMDDRTSPVYGTPGFQAPEIAQTGPTIASDLFTVGRTLAVLCTDFKGYQSTYRTSLPAQRDIALYQRFDSLYRFLERATAADPADRFASAELMAAQLSGVLREVVAESGRPAPKPSTRFTPEARTTTTAAPEWRSLPTPLVNTDDPASAVIVSVSAAAPEEAIEQLRAVPDHSVELQLWLAKALIEADRPAEAGDVLDAIARADPREWRIGWYRGIAALSTTSPEDASVHLQRVYRSLPGELAPKLALAHAAELADDHARAASWYDIVSRTDPSYTSAAFGLARCRLALGDRAAAVAAYARVPDKSHAHVDALIAEVGVLVDDEAAAGVPELLHAAGIVERLKLDGKQRATLSAEVFERALAVLQTEGRHRNGQPPGPLPTGTPTLLGQPLTERGMRLGLESAYRSLAHHAATSAERIRLVDRANAVRPRTLL